MIVVQVVYATSLCENNVLKVLISSETVGQINTQLDDAPLNASIYAPFVNKKTL